MSASILSATQSLSILPAQPGQDCLVATLFEIPEDARLIAMGMDRERYIFEMDLLLENWEEQIKPLFSLLNELPEGPELKLLKAALNDVRVSIGMRARDPATAGQDMLYALVDLLRFYHASRIKPKKKLDAPVLELCEIVPENVTQERAMVLLRLLKAQPKKALHTDDCCKILGGSEGKAIDATMARRAMKFLADTYSPALVLEKVEGSQRVRTNF